MVAVTLALASVAAPVEAAAKSKFRLLRLDGQIVKWGAPELGSPAHVTYAFVDGSVEDHKARNCKSMATLDGLARNSGLSVKAVEAQAEAAFKAWQLIAGITFSRAATPAQADILIGAQAKPRGYAFANVHTRQEPDAARRGLSAGEATGDRGLNAGRTEKAERGRRGQPAVAEIERSAICLNPLHDWKVGRAGTFGAYDLLFTFTHEIGHAIGLDHYNRSGQIMHFKYTEEFAEPQGGDRLGLVKLYGPPRARVAGN